MAQGQREARDPGLPFVVERTEEPAGLVDPTRRADDQPAVAPLLPTAREIETLPPLEELAGEPLPISAATGQPRRAKVMVAAIVLLYLAALGCLASLAWSWWTAIHVASFYDSSWLVHRWHPRPGGWRSIVAVVSVAGIAALDATMFAVAGFNAWNGHRWSRWLALFAVLLGASTLLLAPWTWLAPLVALAGALLLWTPPVGRYFSHWDRFREGTPIPPRPAATEVHYGPLPRYL